MGSAALLGVVTGSPPVLPYLLVGPGESRMKPWSLAAPLCGVPAWSYLCHLPALQKAAAGGEAQCYLAQR